MVSALGAVRGPGAVVHGCCASDVERGGLREIAEEGEGLFVLFDCKLILFNGTAGDDEEDEVPHARMHVGRNPAEFGQMPYVAPRHDRLGLRLETYAARVAKRADGDVEHPRGRLSRRAIRPVEADGHARNAAIVEGVNGMRRQKRRHGRSHSSAKSYAHAVPEQVKKVGPPERIAAGENHERIAETLYFIQ